MLKSEIPIKIKHSSYDPLNKLKQQLFTEVIYIETPKAYFIWESEFFEKTIYPEVKLFHEPYLRRGYVCKGKFDSY